MRRERIQSLKMEKQMHSERKEHKMVETTYMGILCGILGGLVIIGLIGCNMRKKRDSAETEKD